MDFLKKGKQLNEAWIGTPMEEIPAKIAAALASMYNEGWKDGIAFSNYAAGVREKLAAVQSPERQSVSV